MSNQNRPPPEFSLNHDQWSLIELYTNMYNQNAREIDLLHDMQNEIRRNINHLSGLTGNYNNRSFNNNTNSNTNNSRRQPLRQNNHRVHSSARTSINSIPYYYSRETPYTYNPELWSIFNNTTGNFYDRVPVAPTTQQINLATRTLQYSEIENPLNNSCPVTLDRFESNSNVTQIRHCGHIFTPSGINSWLESNVMCPVCRYDIRRPIATNLREESKEEAKEEPVNQERPTNNDIQNTLSSITENILGQILNPGRGENFVLDPSFNTLFFDASNNQFVFEGFLRR